MDTALQEAENDARKLKDLLIPPKTKMDVNYDLKNELNNNLLASSQREIKADPILS